MPPHHIIQLKDIEIEVTRKRVKNLNIRIYPMAGRVAMSVPHRTTLSGAEAFARKKYTWIKKHLERAEAGRGRDEQVRRYLPGEEHPVWGRSSTLSVQEVNRPPSVSLTGNRLCLMVRPRATTGKRKAVLTEWYRSELKREIPKLIEKWEAPMGVEVKEFGVKRMKTRWGTCNIRARRIWLNLELAKRDPRCLEFVVVHEMVHLLERLHSRRFYRLMDRFLPDWKEREALLKSGIR